MVSTQRRRLVTCGLAVLFAALGADAAAQTGGARGKVIDGQGQPVADARIVLSFQGDVQRELETRTKDDGTFVRMGIAIGPYSATASKDGMLPATVPVRIRPGQIVGIDFTLQPDSGITRERISMLEAATALFRDGLAANEAGRFDEAVVKFTEALAIEPTCTDCYLNMGIAHTRSQDYEEAERAFRQAAELEPENPGPHEGLAAMYNAQRMFEQAAAASAEAARLRGESSAGGESADALFDRGLILWNAGNIAEARGLFERTLQLDPTHAESHYWLAMADVNEGKMAEAATRFKQYLDMAPDGRFVEQARAMLSQIGAG